MRKFFYNARHVQILTLLIMVVFSFAFASLTQAGIDLKTPLEKAGAGIYGAGAVPTADSMPVIIGKVIGVVVGLVGMIMIIIVVYAGYLWMTAGGDTDQVKKAKDWIINASIGILICVVAYTLTGFVVAKIFEATTATPAPAPAP